MLRVHLNSASRDEQDLHLGEGESCWDKQPEQELAHNRHLRKYSSNERLREETQGAWGWGGGEHLVRPSSSEGPAKPAPWR